MTRIHKFKKKLTQFPDIPAPSVWMLIMESRFIWELLSGIGFHKSILKFVPKGDKHPVLLIPGLGATDLSTTILRKFLNKLGYITYPWAQGRNRGITDKGRAQLQAKLKQIHEKHGCKVTVIGHSLGGVYARIVANEKPELVRQVITLGTPFTGHPLATSATHMYEWLSGENIENIDYGKISVLQQKPPVPTTSIYSKYDGVVAWRCSIEQGQPSENINLRGHSHMGMTSAPLALYIIANRLSEPEVAWKPFAPNQTEALFFGINDHT